MRSKAATASAEGAVRQVVLYNNEDELMHWLRVRDQSLLCIQGGSKRKNNNLVNGCIGERVRRRRRRTRKERGYTLILNCTPSSLSLHSHSYSYASLV